MNKKPKIIGFVIISIILVVLGPFIKIFFDDYKDGELKKTGIPAKAVVLNIEDTWNRFNDQPIVKITLEVRPEGKEVYQTVKKMAISPVYLPQFQPGAVVNVRYDPKDPKKVVIESIQVRVIK